MIKELEAADPDLLDGYDEMREEDQEKIKKAFEEGHSQYHYDIYAELHAEALTWLGCVCV